MRHQRPHTPTPNRKKPPGGGDLNKSESRRISFGCSSTSIEPAKSRFKANMRKAAAYRRAWGRGMSATRHKDNMYGMHHMIVSVRFGNIAVLILHCHLWLAYNLGLQCMACYTS